MKLLIMNGIQSAVLTVSFGHSVEMCPMGKIWIPKVSVPNSDFVSIDPSVIDSPDGSHCLSMMENDTFIASIPEGPQVRQFQEHASNSSDKLIDQDFFPVQHQGEHSLSEDQQVVVYSGSENLASGISLAMEVESGELALVPFVHNEGSGIAYSFHSLDDMGKDCDFSNSIRGFTTKMVQDLSDNSRCIDYNYSELGLLVDEGPAWIAFQQLESKSVEGGAII